MLLFSKLSILTVCDYMEEGASAILDLSSRYVTAVMRSLSEAMGIFHLSAVDPSYEPSDRSFNLSVNIRPPASVMLQLVRDVVSTENLTNVGIIYDSSFGEQVYFVDQNIFFRTV